MDSIAYHWKNQPVATQAERTLQIFEQTGAYLKGHFRLTSGLHSPEYLQCALVLQDPPLAAKLGEELAEALQVFGHGKAFDMVVSPAIGGLIIGHEVARALGCRFIFAERDGAGRMSLRRGFEAHAGQTAVVVEDVITTGGSTLEVIELLKAEGCAVSAAGSIIDRSNGRVDLGLPRVALAGMDVVSYREDACPLCRDGIPVVKPGSRKS